MPWRHERDENSLLNSNLSHSSPDDSLPPDHPGVFHSTDEIVEAAGELLAHLQRSGIRFVPQPSEAGVAEWSESFTDASEPEQAAVAEAAAPPAATVAANAPSTETTSAPPASPPPRAAMPTGALSATSTPYGGESLPIADRVAQLEAMAQTVAGCTRCKALASCRTQTVFGEGNPAPRFVFFGEGPGADEDKTGRPFVGKAGQLLTKMIEAIRLKREEVYILNTVKCRPPGNRNPEPGEVANCREYFETQLDILRPEYIICLGAVSSQALLQTKLSIGRLRQSFHDYHGSKVLVIYHPAYLLRNPDAKKAAWADLQLLMKDAGL
ncbi:uracil-DNA glycosylase [Aporhodopirellula aestuarii]|uniref:Type-4 uracil-DNA glycosylase n=1 Tax=Aporhodopirellula aestuarii TaxID=2950107 RepID=A0ABT0TZY7_9BACT|nr:uracil-DNA glycosylase [Aporhodopirellula aestuarii]MCM2370174.1 uracil-DNA glycosylase [Aporhodopirellula aestuarii]